MFDFARVKTLFSRELNSKYLTPVMYFRNSFTSFKRWGLINSKNKMFDFARVKPQRLKDVNELRLIWSHKLL
jgi:hypothetical protein